LFNALDSIQGIKVIHRCWYSSCYALTANGINVMLFLDFTLKGIYNLKYLTLAS